MEWPKRARTADWENGVLALDREKQFEVPKLTAEIMERLAGYTPVSYTHLDVYKRQAMSGRRTTGPLPKIPSCWAVRQCPCSMAPPVTM